MARYRGPQSKVARKFKEPIFGPDDTVARKPYPPGHHGPSKRRTKMSEYALQLAEKQKARHIYGLLEKQFYNTFKRASQKKGVTGELLLKFLEARLDNTVFRLGIAPTRAASRQLVSHRHIIVNGRICGIPSYKLKPGDIVSVRERSKSLEVIDDSIAEGKKRYPWLEWDNKTKTGKFLNYPERDEIPENIKEQLIVELYSK